jgi:hypothetical protein
MFIEKKTHEYSTVFVQSGPILRILYWIQAFWEELTTLHSFLGIETHIVIVQIKGENGQAFVSISNHTLKFENP